MRAHCGAVQTLTIIIFRGAVVRPGNLAWISFKLLFFCSSIFKHQGTKEKTTTKMGEDEENFIEEGKRGQEEFRLVTGSLCQVM
jgi:hypothetical protein